MFRVRESEPRTDKLWLLGILIPVFVGVVFMGIGIHTLVNATALKKVCTEEISAVVQTLLEAQTDNDDGSTATVYCPVFAFEYKGEYYTVNKDYYTNPCGYELGETAKLYINPDNPEEFYAEKDSTNTLVPIICTGAGGLCLVVAVIIAYRHLQNRIKEERKFA